MADQIIAPSGSAIISKSSAAKEKIFMGTFTEENLKSLNDNQKEIILGIKAVQESAEAGDELRRTVENMFSLTALLSDDSMTLPAAHGQLRSFPDGRGVAMR